MSQELRYRRDGTTYVVTVTHDSRVRREPVRMKVNPKYPTRVVGKRQLARAASRRAS